MKRLAFAVVLTLLLAGQSWADFTEGVSAYNKKDYATALREFRILAEQGDASAQFNLGVMYGKGKGVPQDDTQAMHWYRLAAEQGNTSAQFNLGMTYQQGSGVPQDDTQAVHWYRLAAEQGHTSAQSNLGVMYHQGRGIPQDDTQAVHWYRLAAEQGDTNAQSKLGLMYDQGRGVPQDDMAAHMWLNLAGAKGNKDAQNLRDYIAEKMPPAQIAEAQQRARIFILQQHLRAAGYNPGPSDGIMGRKTRATLRAFQMKRGLPVTGEPDNATLSMMTGGGL